MFCEFQFIDDDSISVASTEKSIGYGSFCPEDLDFESDIEESDNDEGFCTRIFSNEELLPYVKYGMLDIIILLQKMTKPLSISRM